MEPSSSPGIPNHETLPKCRLYLDITVLIILNVMNYTDRYTLPGIMEEIQLTFDIQNDMGGLLSTAFLVPYLLTAPIFGYLADRFNRKILIAVCVIFWTTANFTCSFIEIFWPLLLLRALFGIFEAGYSASGPIIFGDLLIGEKRSIFIAIFFMAIPFGTGFANLLSVQIKNAANSWRWSLRVTLVPNLMLVMILLLFFVDPKRGQSEGHADRQNQSWREDLRFIFKTKTYLYSSLGFTCTAFSCGALNWWGPKMLAFGFRIAKTGSDSSLVISINGIVYMVSGVLGLILGYVLSWKLRKKYPRIDPILCGIGLLVSTPCLFGATYAFTYNAVLSFSLLFVALLGMNLNWALNTDILLYVIPPEKRSLALGTQLFMGHALGDCGCPYILGVISDALRNNYKAEKIYDSDTMREFKALQYSFFVACVVVFVGGIMFLMAAVYVVQDRTNMLKSEVSLIV